MSNSEDFDTYERDQLRQQDKRRRERAVMARADWEEDGLPEDWDKEDGDENN